MLRRRPSLNDFQESAKQSSNPFRLLAGDKSTERTGLRTVAELLRNNSTCSQTKNSTTSSSPRPRDRRESSRSISFQTPPRDGPSEAVDRMKNLRLATSLTSGGRLYTLAAPPPHIAQIQRRSSGSGPRWRPKKYTTGRHCACRTTIVRAYLGAPHRRLASVSPDDRARM
jgi:hypothetical protein